ncbi:MAG: hypothetical protein ACO3C1_06490 [Ilumatobacteraceae bacterium]
MPTLFTLGMVRARPHRLYDTVDGNLVAGIVHNVRCCGSLTSPTDQYWLRLDVATTYLRLPRVPVADLGPLYPLLVALVPLPVDRAMWVVNALSGAAALVLLAMVVRRVTDSWAAGVAAQVVMVVGPTQHTVFGTVTWSNLVGTTVYDVTAVALLLGAVAASTSTGRVSRWAAALLFAAACAVKPSFVVALVVLAVWRVIEVMLRRGARSDTVPVVSAASAVLAWQFALVPLLFGSAPKALAWHPIRDMGFFEALLGWVRLDGVVRASHAAGLVLGGLCLAVVAVLAVRRSTERSTALLALVLVAGAASVVIGRFVFDAEVVLRDERQLLLVRVAAMALLVIGAHRVVCRWATGPTSAGRITLVVALLVAVSVGTRPWFVALPDRGLPPLVADELASHPDAVVMSNAPTTLYRQTAVSALTMLQPREPTTLRPVYVAGELGSLARSMRDDGRSLVLDVVYDDYYLAVVDPTWFACATLVDRRTAAGVEVSLVALTTCADQSTVVPVTGTPVDVP